MTNHPRRPASGQTAKKKTAPSKKATAAPRKKAATTMSRKTAAKATSKKAATKRIVARKESAAGRITIIRPKQRPEKPRPQLVQRGFPDVEAATRYLLSRAEELVQDGVLPRRAADLYLDALVPVLGFIHDRAELFKEANLGPEVCAAVEQIAAELQAIPEAPPGSTPPRGPSHEAVSTAALLLTAYRDALRRVARGPKGLAARTDFGVSASLDVRDPQQVADGIARFLTAAQAHPEYVADAGLSQKQLDGLAAQARVIVGLLRQQRQRGEPTLKQVRTTQVLHTALEYFFDRFSAAVSAKLLDRPDERIRGLKLVPRDPRERTGGQRSTDPR
jgi:hypothetical protein